MASGRKRTWVLLFLSALPIALLVALERRKTGGDSFEYRSGGWIRESLQWDATAGRFLVSTFFDGGVSEIPFPGPAQERPFLLDPDLAGNSSVGIALDPPRRRLLVVYADPLRHRSSLLAAYDLSSRRRLFLTPLAGAGALADDVAVAPDGTAFVTDADSPRIWKLSPAGELLPPITSPLFRPGSLFGLSEIVGLNGIVYHPSGFLLVVHTGAGVLFRVDLATEEVAVVRVAGGPLWLGDGLDLLSPSRLVVAAGVPSARLVESSDDWVTAAVTASFYGPLHRVAASVAVKDGRAFVQYLLGAGSHVITEAVFTS